MLESDASARRQRTCPAYASTPGFASYWRGLRCGLRPPASTTDVVWDSCIVPRFNKGGLSLHLTMREFFLLYHRSDEHFCTLLWLWQCGRLHSSRHMSEV